MAPSIQALTSVGRPRFDVATEAHGDLDRRRDLAAFQAVLQVLGILERWCFDEIARAAQLLEVGAALGVLSRSSAAKVKS